MSSFWCGLRTDKRSRTAPAVPATAESYGFGGLTPAASEPEPQRTPHGAPGPGRDRAGALRHARRARSIARGNVPRSRGCRLVSGIALIFLGLFAASVHAQSDTTLSSLSLKKAFGGPAIDISPSFSATTLEYTATVGYAITQVTVFATATDGDATVEHLGSAGSLYSTPLGATKTMQVKVTGADDVSTRTYSIAVTRLARLKGWLRKLPDSHDGSTPFSVELLFAERIASPLSNIEAAISVRNGTMSNLALMSGSLRKYSMDITPSGEGPIQIEVRGAPDCTRSHSICSTNGALFDDRRRVKRSVSAEDDARLLNLWFEHEEDAYAGETPAFSPDTLNYEMRAHPRRGREMIMLAKPYTPGVTVAFTAVGASVESVKGRHDGGGEATLRIPLGESTVSVTVTAADGVTNRTYTYTINRGLRDPSCQSNFTYAVLASLSADAVGGTRVSFSPEFDPSERHYQAWMTAGSRVSYSYTTPDRLREAHVEEGKRRPSRKDGLNVYVQAATLTAMGYDFDACYRNRYTVKTYTPLRDGLAVSNARVYEQQGATLDFVVRLFPPRSSTTTVSYATSSGTATEGDDYTADSGTLTFTAGETAKTVSVQVLDDLDDEGSEHMTLRLSNPSSGVEIIDGTAFGFITNSEDNAAPIGLPTISGTLRVGETLTASGSDIEDPNGMDDVTYAWQWIANDGTSDAEIAGATSSTYTLTSSETGKSMKVRASFTDGNGNEESVVSAATAAVADDAQIQQEADTLTASFVQVPAEHDGETVFTVRISFSEELAKGSGRRLWRALSVTGAAKKSVRRVEKRRDLFRVRLKPSGTGAVTLSLASSGVCGSTAALCTQDDLVLSGTVEASVEGPPGLSVADADVNEASDAALSFAVTLSRAASGTVTVEYATSDVSATAGEDYTSASGTLTFDTGETEKTVSVAVLGDEHDEGDETLTLRLSNASGAFITDATATGTISNSGPMPEEWLVRFGRTAADQVLDAVGARLTAPRIAGAEAMLARHRLSAPATPQAPQARGAGARVEGFTGWLGAARNEERPLLESSGLEGRDLLAGSSFTLTGGDAESGFGALWGRGASSHFDGREGELELDGEVRSAILGADFMRGRGTAGLALSHSRGEGGYGSESGTGDIESSLTGIYPYGHYETGERLSLWGVAGYGAGTLRLEPEGARPIETDTGLVMAALGGRGILLKAPADGGAELAAKADALVVRSRSEEVRGNPGNLSETQSEVMRFRLGVESSWQGMETEGGAVFVPSFEIGIRHDWGDAETGLGADFGAGLAWRDPSRGIEAEARARGLLIHEDEGFREYGFSASLAWDPRPASNFGARLTLRHTLGAQARGGMETLFRPDTAYLLGDAIDGGDKLEARRLEARLGYGLPIFGGRYSGTPEIGLGLGDTGREYLLGWRLRSTYRKTGDLELGLEMSRLEAAGPGHAPEHRIGLTLDAEW